MKGKGKEDGTCISVLIHSKMKRHEASRWTAVLYRRTKMSIKKVARWRSWPNSPVCVRGR